MFCVGSKIIFADGRVAVARNGADIVRILSMNTNISSIACKADSFSLNIEFSSGKVCEVTWFNMDLGEKYTLKTDDLSYEDVQKIAAHFMDTGEKAEPYPWEKV